MKEKILFDILVLFSTIALFSCESKDGNWEAMKWKPAVEKSINVPESGETYTFKSINYSSFWIDAIVENGKNVNIASGGVFSGGCIYISQYKKKTKSTIARFAIVDFHSETIYGRSLFFFPYPRHSSNLCWLSFPARLFYLLHEPCSPPWQKPRLHDHPRHAI